MAVVAADLLPLSRSNLALGAIALGAALLFSFAVQAAEPASSSQVIAAYDELQQWQYTKDAFPVPEGGVRFVLDTASWVLESGELWVQKPLPDGGVTGIVFEGVGRFRLGVPDPFELAQLRRFAEEPELERIDQQFSQMVLRFAGEAPFQLPELPSAAVFRPHRLAVERHDHWLRIRQDDVDATVIAALLTPGSRLLRADMKTESWGSLTYDYDSRRLEEIQLDKFQKKNSFVEHWLSLDRPEDRRPDGRPGRKWPQAVDIEHVDIVGDLTKPGKYPRTGLSLTHPFDGRFEVTVRLTNRIDGARAIQLYLHPLARVGRVSDKEGRPLPFLRDHIGGRSSAIDNRVYDDSLLVLLDGPWPAGESRQLRIDYEIELAGFGPGRLWYPAGQWYEVGLRDPHTVRLELTSRESHTIRAVGEPVEEVIRDGHRISVWEPDQPVRMATFTMVNRFHEKRVEGPEGSEVVGFGSVDGYLSPSRIGTVAGKILETLVFFQDLFAERLASPRLQVTLIPANHGQAFNGFLHLGDASSVRTRAGVRERFLAHETAHQWWGNLVGWSSYRDQWLSESFAEYSAMLFVEMTLDRGPELFEEMLQVYFDELNGSLKTMYSGFTRPGLPRLNREGADRIGPIHHGYRCATGDVPTAYRSQAYRKGALVLHMLRVLLRDSTGSDEAFFATLEEFLDSHQGTVASTEDFQETLARTVPGEWSWFFDQWIRRAEIPTYSWEHEVVPAADGEGDYRVLLQVRQEGVPDGFRMPVPVRIELAGGGVERRSILVDEADELFELVVPGRPTKVDFNPDHSVLAKVKGR
ncbi:MAG: M1 family aminopeptidase [Thermoanaerobaculia bacterium]